MELKVRAVESAKEKSIQEVEQELLDKHEEKFSDTEPQKSETIQESVVEDTVVEDTKEEAGIESELSEEQVLSYIGKRYGREINSLEELNAARAPIALNGLSADPFVKNEPANFGIFTLLGFFLICLSYFLSCSF